MIKLLLFIILPFLLSGIAVTAQPTTTANISINDEIQQQPTNKNIIDNSTSNDGIVIFNNTYSIDNQWQANVVIYDGEEPVDVIYNALSSADFAARQQVFEEVKNAGIPYTKEYALLFSQHILLDDDDSFSAMFTCHDNGGEPIDTIYNFAKENLIERFFPLLSSTLIPQLCELVKCNRLQPKIWSNEISSAEDGQPLGMLAILLGDEPVDAVDAFVQNISVDVGDRGVFRQNIAEVVCKTLECSRSTPVVFRMLVKSESGKEVLDSIDIYEGEEVIDAVDRFIRKSKMSLDEVSLKDYMLQEACKGDYRVKCTKNVGVAEDGSSIANNTMQL